MDRRLGDQLRQRGFALTSGVKEVEAWVSGQAARRQCPKHLPFEDLVEGSHRPITNAVDGRMASPIFYVGFQLAPLRVARGRAFAERFQQQLPPAGQEQRPIVELNAHHRFGRGLLECQKRVANLPRAMAVGVSAVSHLSQGCPAENPGIGGPNAPGRRIYDLRILFGAKPPLPAPTSVSPGGGYLPVEADSARNSTGQWPPSPPRGIRADEVLRRDP